MIIYLCIITSGFVAMTAILHLEIFDLAKDWIQLQRAAIAHRLRKYKS